MLSKIRVKRLCKVRKLFICTFTLGLKWTDFEIFALKFMDSCTSVLFFFFHFFKTFPTLSGVGMT